MIKSKERVQKFGEVFTPIKIVNAMIGNENFLPHVLDIHVKIFEPTFGEGIFLTEILKRRLEVCHNEDDILTALANLYGVELQADNVQTARANLHAIIDDKISNKDLAAKIIDANFIQGDFLTHKKVDGAIIFFRNWQIPSGNFKTFTLDDFNEKNALQPKLGLEMADNQLLANELEDLIIIGNPPYQEDTGGAGKQARPLYNLFVDAAKNLHPKFISLIIPSRWFAGGMGLDKFRKDMMNDRHLKAIVDYTNAKECFPQQDISGGVCYFIWDKNFDGDCEFTNITNGKKSVLKRSLNEFPVLVRYNSAIPIIRKIREKSKKFLSEIVSGLMPFGLNTNYRGNDEKTSPDQLTLYASGESITYIDKEKIVDGLEYVDKFKVMISKTSAEHAGEPDNKGRFRVFTSSLKVLKPNEICTHSYFLIGKFDEEIYAENLLSYLKTNFVRFLVLVSLSSINLSKLVFHFVPLQNFRAESDINWTASVSTINQQLYDKYGLTDEEKNFIESHVKAMD